VKDRLTLIDKNKFQHHKVSHFHILCKRLLLEQSAFNM
jgi:hypothetical protein